VVLGAGGGAGGAVVRRLLAQGREVRAVTRTGGGDWLGDVEAVGADARDATAVRAACEGARVVYHCVNVPYPEWETTLPAIMDSVIEGAERAGATLVYCDNLYMYGPVQGPIHEGSPCDAGTAKGALRARLAESLLEAHAQGRVRAVIGRGSDFFGPGAPNTVAGQLVFPAVVAGKKAHWLGALDQPHSLCFIDDFARGLIALGESPRAAGEVWHIPANGAPTGRAFIELAFATAGTDPKLGVYPRWMVRLLSLLSPDMRELVEILYQFEHPFILDTSKFAATFGDLGLTPMREAMARTLEWQTG
jgi:nucleoside-diphosphate-sugar epimerase